MIPSTAYVARTIAAFAKAWDRAGNPWDGHDEDLARTWDAVDETTRSIAFARNYHEVRVCVLRRLNHAAVEGAHYRGDQR